MSITKNAVYCVPCETEIESVHTHDFKWCPGGHIAVDGGHAYLRRAGDLDGDWVDTSVGADDLD